MWNAMHEMSVYHVWRRQKRNSHFIFIQILCQRWILCSYLVILHLNVEFIWIAVFNPKCLLSQHFVCFFCHKFNPLFHPQSKWQTSKWNMNLATDIWLSNRWHMWANEDNKIDIFFYYCFCSTLMVDEQLSSEIQNWKRAQFTEIRGYLR